MTGSGTRGSGTPTRTMGSATEILELLDPSGLPAEARETLQAIGSFLAAGWSFRRIAEETGWPEELVSRRVRELRVALLRQAQTHLAAAPPRLRMRLEQLLSEHGLA